MGEQAYLDAVWRAVPEGAVPEAFAARREWLLGRVRPGRHVLDLGCGEGWFSAALHAAGARPVCVDAAAEPLRRLRARFPELTDVRQMEPGGAIPLHHGEAEVVWLGEVLGHVLDVAGLLSECRRVLARAGRLLVTTPDHNRRMLARMAVDGLTFDARFDPDGAQIRFFSRRTLYRMLVEAGFENVHIAAFDERLWAMATRR